MRSPVQACRRAFRLDWRSGLQVLLVLLLPALASAQAPPPSVHPAGEDSHALRFLLSRVLKCKPLAVDDLLDEPRHSVLIVLGSTTWMDDDEMSDKLTAFVRRGGAALIASDSNGAETMGQLFGIRTVGRHVEARDPKKDGYRGWRECPLISASNANKDYPFFRNIDHIATYQPGYLRVTQRGAAIATFPESCMLEWGDVGTVPVFAAVSEPNHTLVLSTQSVFWNNRMLQYDNDNFAFAYRCLRWVTEATDQDVTRPRVLVMDDGNPLPSFDVKVREMPNTLPENLGDLPAHPVDIANALLAKWEDENIHNELIFGNFSGSQILSGVVIALTVVLAVWLFWRLQQALHRTETG